MNVKHPAVAALVAVAVLGLTGCGSGSDDSADPASTPTRSTTAPASTSPSASAPSTEPSDTMGGTHDMGHPHHTGQAHGMGDMVMIDIKDFMYDGGMSVEPGQMVMVTNDDSEAHTLTSDDTGLFSVTVQAGATAMFDAPSKPGSYAYHCDFHANMHGSLVVG